jgi:hypothetical protein
LNILNGQKQLRIFTDVSVISKEQTYIYAISVLYVGYGEIRWKGNVFEREERSPKNGELIAIEEALDDANLLSTQRIRIYTDLIDLPFMLESKNNQDALKLKNTLESFKNLNILTLKNKEANVFHRLAHATARQLIGLVPEYPDRL